MPLRIGIVDYLNAWPLAWGFLSGRLKDGMSASYHPPARIASMLADGELDVGLIPSIEVQRIDGLRVVPGLCVGATHEVQSVILVARRPFDEIRSVALDENSRTSATLVRIILRDLYGVVPETTTRAPEVESMLETSDAALLIGDPALTVDRRRYRVLDLAGEWRRLTGRPFVFAVWAVTEGVDSDGIGEELVASLGMGVEELDRVIDRAVEELDLDHAVVERYLLRQLRFALGVDELAGLEEFYRRAHAIGAIGEPRPIRFL